MHTQVRKIGNSKGVILPAALLETCRIEDAVDLTVENGCIVLRPVVARNQWFTQPVDAEQDVDAWAGAVDLPSEQDDAEW